jgi:hypothetical protein
MLFFCKDGKEELSFHPLLLFLRNDDKKMFPIRILILEQLVCQKNATEYLPGLNPSDKHSVAYSITYNTKTAALLR